MPRPSDNISAWINGQSTTQTHTHTLELEIEIRNTFRIPNVALFIVGNVFLMPYMFHSFTEGITRKKENQRSERSKQRSGKFGPKLLQTQSTIMTLIENR